MESTNLSFFGATSVSIPVLLVGTVTWLYLAYRWCLPKPITGIPYNKDASKSLLGDAKGMAASISKTGEIFSWIVQQNIKHKSPVIQILRPFSRPWVIVTDYRESQDILMRRTKEFDRSDFIADLFAGLVPDHHIRLKTADPEFKEHRRLLQDLMSPGFLHDVAATNIYSAVLDLLGLWKLKLEVAQGHPFSAAADIYHAALDAIWAVTFGTTEVNTTKSQIQHLSRNKDSLKLPANPDQPISIPEFPIPAAFDAVLSLTDDLERTVKFPIPKLHAVATRHFPSIRKAHAIKDKVIADELQKSVERLQGQKNVVTRCAIDDILRRELAVAKKEGRAPCYNTKAMFDEVIGFVIAGTDTTSTTLTWGLKFLADNPEAQEKLRSKIRAAHTSAVLENRRPSAQEIIKIKIPYLDAAIEEIVRKSITSPAVSRQAMVDTEVLGYRIPKGTDVFLMANGPNIFQPAFPVDEEVRSMSCRAAKEKIGSWSPDDMNLFKPERWLSIDEEGNEIFDSTAGPHLAFGMGPRGCFGRKLAYLEMRLVLFLLIWEFELKKVPRELGGYDAFDKMTRQPQKCYVRLGIAT